MPPHFVCSAEDISSFTCMTPGACPVLTTGLLTVAEALLVIEPLTMVFTLSIFSLGILKHEIVFMLKNNDSSRYEQFLSILLWAPTPS